MGTESKQDLRAFVQPVAVWVTALFAIFVYWKKDAPALEPRSSAFSALEWYETKSQNTCRAAFQVGVENKGVTAFEIRKIRVRAWKLATQEADKQNIVFDDVDAAIQVATPITDKVYAARGSDTERSTAAPLVARYSAGMSYNHTFEWLVPRELGSRFYVRADLFQHESDSMANWYSGQWSDNCGMRPVSSASQPTN